MVLITSEDMIPDVISLTGTFQGAGRASVLLLLLLLSVEEIKTDL